MSNKILFRYLNFLFTLFIFTAFSIDASAGYDQPPKEILDVMRAPSPATPYMSPTLDQVLLVSMEDYPSIEQVATPFLRLAGVRIEPKNRSRHDTPGGNGIPTCVRTLTLVRVADGQQKNIDLSKLNCADSPFWSADGKYFFIKNKTQTAVELWIGEVQLARVFKIPGVQLNPMLGFEVQWMPDQKNLLIKLTPSSHLKLAPAQEITPLGPSTQESLGERGQSSTYEKRDTLNNKHDEKLFDYYALSQLALVNVQSRKLTLLGAPALYERLRPAPNGVHILVTEIIRPYSYIVTYERFPKKIQVLDISHPKKISPHLIAELPLADRVPIHGVPTGPRGFTWSPHAPASLIWAEALDGGDWNVKVPARDKILLLAAPFKSAPIEIFKTEQRYSGFMWLEQKDKALLSEYDKNKHWEKTWIVNVDDPKQEKKILWDLSSDEEYAYPGDPVMRVLKNGFAVIRQNQNFIYLSGKGASTEGDRPFLDKMDLNSLKNQRLFRSANTEYERFLSFVDGSEKTFLTWHQTPTTAPNAFKRQLGSEITASPTEAIFSSAREALTQLPDPTPQIRSIKKQLVKYKRADGLDLSFTLYTPPNYKEGTRLPTILYAYPLDYAEASKAGQIKGSQFTFTRLLGHRLLLMAGFAVIDRAAFPIVGDPKKAYDTYTEQLVADAKAAVDQAVKMGVADPERIGITGHSHGALMTVNLLVHSELFRAGVATSGSYNKTLTPFGFQNERRTLWEAPEVYQKTSPLFYADKLKTPLLLIHGEDDANSGTTPLQARLLYEALRGNGGMVRLVMLPHEPHWYTARESNEQEIYEMLKWFDKYVKNAPEKKSEK